MNLPDMILYNGKITTLDPSQPEVSAIAITDGLVTAVGGDEILNSATEKTKKIDLKRKRAIPGLNDSHIHVIRGGLHYNMELRWEGVPSLFIALEMLKEQARRTPAPQWVRVVGGWSEFQFKERRMPTLEEINAVSEDTPVFVLHLYDRALVNRAGLRALGYTKDTPDPPGCLIQRDKRGNPTGLLIANPNASILYSSLGKAPVLNLDDQINSTRHFMRELNRLGITSAIDAGGGFQNYPDDYKVVEHLAEKEQLTLRIAYNLFTQNPNHEYEDFASWAKIVSPGQGNDKYKMNGAGEMLVFSAADFEKFQMPRPELATVMEADLKKVISLLVENRWPFRLHATYDESITRFLNVFEEVNREIPFNGLRWWFDHAETISDRSMERVKALNGGIAIQDRMAFQGEYFVDLYGKEAAKHTPPIYRMLDLGIPVGAGSDATRVSSYNPWVALYWMVAGKTIGGLSIYDEKNKLDRKVALELYSKGSAWFSGDESKKGTLAVGQFADIAVLSADYFTVPEEEIKDLESLLTIMGGQVVYGNDEFKNLSPELPPASPDWSPTGVYGYGGANLANTILSHDSHDNKLHSCSNPLHQHTHTVIGKDGTKWGIGCTCFAF
ncbi:amidohydrolase [Bacillus thuringiensis]|jgi:predicted amidohydrolase YtcJ|uniref:Amidohydrolase n=1 Tax=Bacillus thuringiensis subsp. higo TaxID=132266 RepID=A0A9X6LQP4_BACUH|nr:MULTISPECIES: amidohydrolase [Bacillus]KIQ85246.1 amidohydrolase [Bacillus sp. L_1B0_5]KIQ88844.1 amidohydrolase [Bacillus sp. L_1B0_8]MDM8362181.1 amidohydrolase [Bacillus thuringiensis]MED2787356.1 amidohydrolase [Bacillus thuringiensis]MED2806435.1 amidohydrolase [Bacillus thuringiensis]